MYFLSLVIALSFREGYVTVLPLEHELHERLLDLLCRFSPQQLLSFLHTSQHYRLEEAIEVHRAKLECKLNSDNSVTSKCFFICR